MNKRDISGWLMLIFFTLWIVLWMAACFLVMYNLKAVLACFLSGTFSFILAYDFKEAMREFEEENDVTH